MGGFNHSDELIVLWPHTSERLPKRLLWENFLSQLIIQEDPARLPFLKTSCWNKKEPQMVPAMLSDVTEPRREKKQQLSLGKDNGPFI